MGIEDLSGHLSLPVPGDGVGIHAGEVLVSPHFQLTPLEVVHSCSNRIERGIGAVRSLVVGRGEDQQSE